MSQTLARIYTRTGDKGETGLLGGSRVPKNSLRVQAYGDIDELNSIIGVVRTFSTNQDIEIVLEGLQRDLFTAGTELAHPNAVNPDDLQITSDKIVALEKAIDRFQEKLPPLKVFILPGGSKAGALLHFARTIARRAERNIVALNTTEKVSENLIPFVNRISDLLFVMARLVNQQDGLREQEWHKIADRHT